MVVIFRTSAEGPRQGEIESNVNEEYGKILDARHEQEALYEEDVLEAWGLARDIAARNDNASDVDAMDID